jgi:glycogen(starch) synthase
MKLLTTADTVGGVWTYAVDLARGLAPLGVEIALATMGGPVSESQRKQIQRLDNITLFESNFKLEWMKDPWDDVQASSSWLLEIEQQFKPDVVHLNGYAHGSLPFFAPKLVVGHSCVLSWWRACRGGEVAPPEWNHYRDRVQRGLQAADLVIAPSRAMLSELLRHYGHLRNTQAIPNGREIECYAHSRKKELFVLAAGRLWDEAKNLAVLDSAAAHLSRSVYVAGDNKHPDGGLASSKSVRLLGRLNETTLAHWYSRAAIYALPARYEPFGLSVLEAALSGCALVLGDVPSLRENWDGVAAFVNPDDSTQLRQTIQQLIDDPVRRVKLSKLSSCRASRFTLESFGTAYFAAYQSLLAGRPDTTSKRSTLACAS